MLEHVVLVRARGWPVPGRGGGLIARLTYYRLYGSTTLSSSW